MHPDCHIENRSGVGGSKKGNMRPFKRLLPAARCKMTVTWARMESVEAERG